MSAPRAVVCYDEARPGMYLRIEGQDIASFMASAAWRAWLYYPASAVDGTDRDRILLDGGMGLRECQDMLEAIMEADGHGVEIAVDPSFGAFVNAGETYIRERSEVGLAIKTQTAEGIADDPQLGPRFREFRDVVNASMVRPLRDRQMLDAFFMATVGRAADFSVPGAGKTATVLGVFAYLRHLGLARRIVVVCPKNGFESWEKEWVATFGDKLPLSCFSLGDPAIAAMSTERRRNALSLDSGACNLFTFNYESLSGYVRELHAIIPDQTLLVFDEVHRVKAIGGRRAEAALEAADGAKFVIALTGTPIPVLEYDTASKAVFQPGNGKKCFPAKAVFAFLGDEVENYAHTHDGIQIDEFESATRRYPIYECLYNQEKICLCPAPVGSAAAVQVLEYLIAAGVTKIISVGSCGVLEDIPENRFLIPVSALRDEGTSYHYLPPSREVEISKAGINAIESALSQKNIPYWEVKTWTTDGFYRETVEMVQYRKEEGCQVVEMECSALAACAKFRKVTWAMLLFSADTLADPHKYQEREWGKTSISIALELALDAVLSVVEE